VKEFLINSISILIFTTLDLKIGPPTNEKADVMMNHYHYDPKELNKHMKGGYKLIVSVREPVSWIISCSFYKRHLV